MPYNVTHGIYPRCAYDDVSENYTIFMLRCPSVIKEKQYSIDKTESKLLGILTHIDTLDFDSNEGLNAI